MHDCIQRSKAGMAVRGFEGSFDAQKSATFLVVMSKSMDEELKKEQVVTIVVQSGEAKKGLKGADGRLEGPYPKKA
eukprot:1140012-Pelagomonas_calceolata.AAC.6